MIEKLFRLGYSKEFAERYFDLWGERAVRIAEAMERPLPQRSGRYCKKEMNGTS